MINKTLIGSLVICVAAGVGSMFGYVSPENFKAIWSVLGPVVLGLLGIQQQTVIAETRQIRSRMLDVTKPVN